MANVVASLDIPETQVLIDFFDDADGFIWHQRILVQPIGPPGRWVVCTPDLDIEAVNLTGHQVVPLARAAPIPQYYRNEAYCFAPMTEAELLSVRERGKALAAILGPVAPAVLPEREAAPPTGLEWRISNPGDRNFGELVPDAVFGDDANVVVRGEPGSQVGLVRVDGVWTTMEPVKAGTLEQWRAAKATGPGRDPRLIGDSRDHLGRRFITFDEAQQQYRQQPRDPGWVFEGPSVAAEFMQSMRTAGLNFQTYSQDWIRKSGVAANSAAGRKHASLCELLRLAQQYDLYDLTNSTSMEFAVRSLVQTETAARRNPKAPDYSNLDHMLTTALDEHGSAQVATFTRWSTNILRDEAQILKQFRLSKEEADALEKNRAKSSGDSPARK
jgi:hypothetical protein